MSKKEPPDRSKDTTTHDEGLQLRQRIRHPPLRIIAHPLRLSQQILLSRKKKKREIVSAGTTRDGDSKAAAHRVSRLPPAGRIVREHRISLPLIVHAFLQIVFPIFHEPKIPRSQGGSNFGEAKKGRITSLGRVPLSGPSLDLELASNGLGIAHSASCQ